MFSPEARGAVPEIRKIKNATNEKARHVLGWAPRPAARLRLLKHRAAAS